MDGAILVLRAPECAENRDSPVDIPADHGNRSWSRRPIDRIRVIHRDWKPKWKIG